MSVTAYLTVVGHSPGELDTAVAAAIGNSYQPQGGPYLNDNLYCQAMILGTPNVNNNASAAASVLDGATLAIKNSAGADSHNATATVSGNAITAIKFASTVAMVDNGDALVIPVTGVYATTATVTVVAGVPTAIVLS